MGEGVASGTVVGVVGVRVGLAVAVEGVGRSTCAVAVATLVVPAVLVGVAAGGEAVVVDKAVFSASDESPVQAASKNSPAASDTSATASKSQVVDSLLAMAGLPACSRGLHAFRLPRHLNVGCNSVEIYVIRVWADCRV